MVLKSSSRSDVSEALRLRPDCSTGIQRVLTVWPGRYGQVVVDGWVGSWVSEDASSSYCVVLVSRVTQAEYPGEMGGGTHVVVVGVPHLQTAIPFRDAAGVTVADDVLEGVAAPPLAAVSLAVALHCVGGGEIVPGADEMHSLD
jgi:hypothetical protein